MSRWPILLSALSFLFVSCGEAEKPSINQNISAESKTMDSISAVIGRAKELQAKGNYNQAMTLADEMLQRYPGQLDALSIKAEILKEQGKSEEALRLLEQAYAMQPRDKETAYNLAYEYADAKNAKALAFTDTLIKYDKTATVARAWYIKATYFLNIGNENEALRFLDSSNIADVNFADAYFDKGQLLFKQKKYEAALKTFALGQKFNPGVADFYLWIGKTQEAMGNKTDAKANYERAFALDESLTEAKEAAEKL